MDNLIEFPWYVSLPVCRRLSLLFFTLISRLCVLAERRGQLRHIQPPVEHAHNVCATRWLTSLSKDSVSFSSLVFSANCGEDRSHYWRKAGPYVLVLHHAELTRRAARSYLECGPCSILPLKLQLQHFLHFPNLTCWKTENQRLVIRRGSCGPFHGVGRATDPPTGIVGDSRLNPRVLNVRKFWASYPIVCIYLMLQHGIYTHPSTPPQLKKLPSVSTDR